jgi:hypothetical protein
MDYQDFKTAISARIHDVFAIFKLSQILNLRLPVTANISGREYQESMEDQAESSISPSRKLRYLHHTPF